MPVHLASMEAVRCFRSRIRCQVGYGGLPIGQDQAVRRNLRLGSCDGGPGAFFCLWAVTSPLAAAARSILTKLMAVLA